MKKKIFIFVLLFLLATIFSTIFFTYKNKLKTLEQNRIAQAEEYIKKLYQDNDYQVPKLSVTEKEIQNAKNKVEKIESKKKKETFLNNLKSLLIFVKVKTELYNYFEEDVLILTVTNETLESIQTKIEKLPKKQRELLTNKLEEGKSQLAKLEEAKTELKKLFVDDSMEMVRENVTRNEKNHVYELMKNLKQTTFLVDYQEKLDLVEAKLTFQEEKKRKEIEAEKERQRKIDQELKKKKEEEQKKIQNAYVEIKGIPYINQKNAQVYNGCEAASLLMSLQYRKQALNHNLTSFATMMPKHDSDPHQGFIHSIFDLEPKDVTHWIAPDALTRFGSHYGTVKNVSGISPAQIRNYIDNQTPVIVYVTGSFRAPTSWDGEVPLNLHVVLVSGYNQITGSYIVLDPWSGKTTVSSRTFESIYQLLKYAVVVE